MPDAQEVHFSNLATICSKIISRRRPQTACLQKMIPLEGEHEVLIKCTFVENWLPDAKYAGKFPLGELGTFAPFELPAFLWGTFIKRN